MVTVGELSHSALGFYSGHWSPDAHSILAHGYGGSFHMWKNIGVSIENWQSKKVPSWHFAAVTDIAWARCGEYMLLVSYDQVRCYPCFRCKFMNFYSCFEFFVCS